LATRCVVAAAHVLPTTREPLIPDRHPAVKTIARRAPAALSPRMDRDVGDGPHQETATAGAAAVTDRQCLRVA
jgi:hypothetical protein